MNPALTLVIAAAVTLFHFWASRRSPKYWFLGGIVPLVWAVLVVVLFQHGLITLREDWGMLLVPTLILLLVWAVGQKAARKRESDRMRARDLD